MKRALTTALLLIALVLAPLDAALAAISFTQIDDDVFLVTHRVKVIGSRGKAGRMVYTKAASLCMAAGFTHLLVLGEDSQASQQYESATASLRVKFFWDDADDRIDCKASAETSYMNEAATKLRRMGYAPPPRQVAPPRAAAAGPATSMDTGTGTCTLEQIAAMARTGLSDARIKAACAADG